MRVRPLVPFVALAWSGPALAVSVLLPSEGSLGEYDVVPRTDGSVTIVTDTSGTTCNVYPAASGGSSIGSTTTSTAVTDPYTGTSGYTGTVSIGSVTGHDDAVWRVVCGSATQYFWVVADASGHRRAFLGGDVDATNLGLTPTQHLGYLADEYDLNLPNSGLYDGTTVPTPGDNSWVRESAWWYLLSVSDYGSAEGPNGVCGSSCGVPREFDENATSATSDPSIWTSSAPGATGCGRSGWPCRTFCPTRT